MDIAEQNHDTVHNQATPDSTNSTARKSSRALATNSSRMASAKGRFCPRLYPGADEAHDNFYQMWQQVPVPLPKRGQTRLLIWSATPENIVSTNRFPGGYGSIIDRLNPNTIWFFLEIHCQKKA